MPALVNVQTPPAVPLGMSALAEGPDPQSSVAVNVSSVPGSVNVVETGTVTPPAVRAIGAPGTTNGDTVGATLAIVAVVRAVSTPPWPSATASMMSYDPLSAYT